MNAEQGQIEAMKQQLADYAKKPRDIDFSPIAALTDSWTGSDFAKHYKAPQSDEQRAETMAKLQNIISQRNGDLTKQKIALMVAQNGGDKTLMGSDKRDPLDALREKEQRRIDNSAHQRVLLAVKKDPVLAGMAQKARALATSLDYIDNVKATTTQQLSETQNVIRRNLGMTGTSGVDERDKTMMTSLGLDNDRARQYLFGSVVDSKETAKEFLAHLRELVELAQGNTKVQAYSEIEKMTAGNPGMYERNPQLKRGLDEVIFAHKKQFERPSLSAFPLKPIGHQESKKSAPAAAPKMSFQEFQKRKREGTL
jgi:hypothetical protein